MKIQLELSKHCIETEIKRHNNRALSDYSKTEKDKGLCEKVIEFTGQALRTFYFAGLRRKYPPLSGHTDHNIVLSTDNNKISITIDGRPIEPITKASVYY